MKKTFVNFTNHPSAHWASAQYQEALRYGEIVDLLFPNVVPTWTEEQIDEVAEEMTEKILDMNPAAVLCQGEFTLCYAVIKRLQARGVLVLAACSERRVTERMDAEGIAHKEAMFRFIQFRAYGKNCG